MNNLKPGIQEHLWEVWLVEDQSMRGRIISEWRATQLKGKYEYQYKIQGREHVYYIVSHDPISREQAIWFAKKEYEGKLHRVHIDLNGIGQ